MGSASDQHSSRFLPDGSIWGDWWEQQSDRDRIICKLCPRECHLKAGDRGFCFVRENRDGKMVLSTYGRSTGFCIDPIEKKPLNHFYPGTSVLSFGTAGCNLGCQFCQNWDISKSREVERLSESATPEMIAQAAEQLRCTSVAFTYNDPVIWAEYAIDTARACRERGIHSVAVTAGYISKEARVPFFEAMDGANVDLKGFTEEFYSKITYSHLAPVLDTLRYLKQETEVWLEITNLIIPKLNDDPSQLQRMCDWIIDAIGPEVPLHFSAFHPDFRMRDRPNTPHQTLIDAYHIAKKAGIHYVYVGNVHDKQRQSTYCPNCQELLIERDWHQIGIYTLDRDRCHGCGTRVAGRFAESPGNWGQRRQPVRIQSFADSSKELKNPTSLKEVPLTKKVAMSSQTPAQTSTEPIRLESLTDELKGIIHRLASRFISGVVLDRPIDRSVVTELGELATRPVMGLFVTLKRGKQLRGCCGLIGMPVGLVEAMANATYRTAKEDTRLPPISPSELHHLELDVTLLGPSEVISGSPEDILRQFELGRHGLRIAKGNHAGLLLPSVPVEQGWDKVQFMTGLCRKAGLQDADWKSSEARIERFAGVPIEGKIESDDIAIEHPRAKVIVTQEQVLQLRAIAAQNIIAIVQGATPSYVNPGAVDGMVNGLVLSLFDMPQGHPLAHLIRLSIRPGMPLQSTLFELCQMAASILQQARPARNVDLEISLTVLHDPSLHGQSSGGEEIDVLFPDDAIHHLQGVRTTERAIVTMLSSARVSVAWDSQKSPETLLQESMRSMGAHGRRANIYSMEAVSTRKSLLATSAPAPQGGPGIRAPAVAGTFYPLKDLERLQEVDRSLADLDGAVEKRSALALMTPHAGIKYSGKIAADVWKRVRIPQTVLIIGPKHTPHGVDWAVAPYRRWQISPSMEFEADQALAQAIVDGVDGMQLDAAAHQQEHGIEVQLPFLERLAPAVKIAAIAMGPASWNEIQRASRQLANVLRSMKEPPLLVISSDMNHYAEEKENRRRDRMALDTLLASDPQSLIDTCAIHQISMCGVIPAALVLQTLKELGKSFHVEEVSYGTSGSVSGDFSRVVGYAGVLLVESQAGMG